METEDSSEFLIKANEAILEIGDHAGCIRCRDDRGKLAMWCQHCRDGADQALAEQARLQAWVNDLQAGCYVNCVYCGHQYGPEESTPLAMADVLKAHIEKCPQHPLAAAMKRIEELERELKLSQGATFPTEL